MATRGKLGATLGSSLRRDRYRASLDGESVRERVLITTARLFDAERVDRLDPAAQRQSAQVARANLGPRPQRGECFGRRDERAAEFAGPRRA